MTLLREIMLMMIAIFIFLFSANFLLTVHESRAYLEIQMQTHAQDTATSLGLSMTSALAENDLATLELLASAIFDRGYYQEIILTDLDGKTLVSKSNPVTTDDVPDWFTELINLPSPLGSTEIMGDWLALGTLNVTAHPGHAYRDLWRISVDYFYLFCFIVILSYGLIGIILKLLMRPLAQVEQMANEICDRKFPVLQDIPRTRELKRVVKAMNRMSTKVKDMFQRQVNLTESLRVEAKIDPVTGIINRREFDAQVNAVMASESGPGASTLMLLQIRHISEINNTLGRAAADDLLKQVADSLIQTLKNVPNAIVSRRSGADFAIYIAHTHLELARMFLQKTFQAVASLGFFSEEANRDTLHIGASFHENVSELPLMLSTSDTALRNAQNGDLNNTSFFVYGDGNNPISNMVKQSQEWKQSLDEIIEKKDVLFYYQPIFSLHNDELIAHEIFVRIELNGKIVNAGSFIPIAERFGMLPQLDKIIISQALAQLNENSPNFVLNLSTRSIQDETFVTWLLDMLEQYQYFADKIIFELQEYSVHLAYDRIKTFIDTAANYGYRFSIDHFGSGATAFSYLQSLNIHFIKIDRSFVAGIEGNKDNQFFIQSVAQIAHTRDMQLIAEGVEQDAELKTLKHLGVDAAMGYLLGKPDASFF